MNTYIERNTVFQTNHLLTTKRDDKDQRCLALWDIWTLFLRLVTNIKKVEGEVAWD